MKTLYLVRHGETDDNAAGLIQDSASQLSERGRAEAAAYLEYARLATEHITDPAWHYADEENFHDIMVRVREVFARLETRSGTTVAVTHGRFITFLVSYALLGDQLTPEVWPTIANGYVTSNTGITVLKFHPEANRWRLHSYNDIAHFAQ